jgi:pilus assembly protein CpaE
MEQQGSAALTNEAEPNRYDVGVVDPDARHRMKLGMQLAGSQGAAQFENVDELIAKLRPGRACVVILGPGLSNPHGLEQVQRLTLAHAQVGAVLVVEELSTQLLQQALRAGVRDAVTISAGDAALRQSVRRVGDMMVAAINRAAGAADTSERGRLIVSFSTKGGVGKSMVATNLGVMLAQRSSRPVAILDGDLQFGDVAVLLGVPPQHTVVDAAAAINQGDPEIMRTLMSRHEESGLLILPAPVEPSAADLVRPEEMVAITEAMRKMCAFVVVDMPPHFDDMVLALLEAADDVLVVASMDIPSIKNLKVGMQTLDLLSLAGPKLRLVLNRANAKVSLDVKEVERALGIRAEFPVPSDIAVPQAVNQGVPVVLHNPKSPAARALEQIADAFIPKPVPEAVPTNKLSRRQKRRQG